MESSTVEKDSNYDEAEVGTPLWKKCFAEFFGTGLIVLFGVGVVNTAVFTGAQSGIWQVAVVWGFGILIAIVLTAPVSGAHLNPAVTFAFTLFRPSEFDRRLALPYIVSQFAGAFFFAFVNYFIFYQTIQDFHRVKGIEAFNDEAAVLSAMAFGEYFPNPAFHFLPILDNNKQLQQGPLDWSESTINFGRSLFIEALGTALLVLVIFSVTSEKNTAVVNKDGAPFYIAFTVAVMISLWAPLNQAGFNPARDFGPRLAALCLGYGEVAIPGPNFDFIPYILGPMIGGPLGAAVFEFLLKP